MGTIVSAHCQMRVLNAMPVGKKLKPRDISAFVPYETATVKAAIYVLLKAGKIRSEGPDGQRFYWREG